jgi:hypothetical protein
MMNMKSEELKIELIASEEAFLSLKDEWDALIDKSSNPSFYATYPFVYTAWKYFKSENDQLFILLVRRDATLVAIAPFRIQSMKAANIRLLRVIRFIAEWGGGDKPAIVTTEEPERMWDRIFQYLDKEYTQWDMISIAEQPANSPVFNQKILGNIRYSTRIVPEFTSYYVPITGTWEEYLKTRGKNTQRTLRYSRKKLFNLPEGVYFQCIEDPETLPEALARYIRIEQSGWKKNLDFTIGGSEENMLFHKELLKHLVDKHMVAIYFLTSKATDIASTILYKHKSTVYSARITYNPEYAKYSPGVILNTEIIKTLFGTHYQTCDFFGFDGEENNTFKKSWCSGTLDIITLQIYKKSLYMSVCIFLYVHGYRLFKYLPRRVSRE